MSSRYINREVFSNTDDMYDNIFDKRKVNFVQQFNTANLIYPTPSQIATLNVSTEIWKIGDRYWKYASKHYNNPELWWVIAWFNQKPSEGDLKIGDKVLVPGPVEKVLEYYGY